MILQSTKQVLDRLIKNNYLSLWNKLSGLTCVREGLKCCHWFVPSLRLPHLMVVVIAMTSTQMKYDFCICPCQECMKSL